MIAKFDKATLQKVRNEMNAVLAKYAAEAGLEISVGSIKFSDSDFEAKVNCKIAGARSFNDKVLESVMAANKLNVDGIGGRRLVEYKSRNHAYPFIFEVGGKRFKCSLAQAQVYFGKK